MDFLEIRRKAKERAEARARAAAPLDAAARADAGTAAPPPGAAAVVSPVPIVPAAPAATPAPLTLEDTRAPAFEPAPLADFSRVEPFEAVLQAVAAAGGELTPIPDIPPWSEALTPLPPEDGARERATVRWQPAEPPAPAQPAAATDPLDEFFYREGETAPGIPDVDVAVAVRPAEVEVADPRQEFLTFLLGDEEYAIDIERVREVLKAPVITDVPRAPAHVLGVIMVRGDVIAVFDPRRRLGLPPVDRPATPRVVVCDDGLGPIGLLVDAVSQVVRLRRSEVEPRPQGIGGVSAEYIHGIGRQAGRMFIVLDLPVVLRGKVATQGGAEEAA